MIQITALSAFSDNYIWLLQDDTSRRCAVVDPGDAGPVERWLDAHPAWTLSDILVTHHHHDHTGGVAALKARTGARVAGPARETIPALDLALEDNAELRVLGLTLHVVDVPGHTAGHIAFVHRSAEQPFVLSGDTLFAGGCGRLFEGTAQQMHVSLGRLAALPDDTLVYCAHEYTLSNLRFAREVEPANVALAERFAQVQALRERNEITLPSSIGLEKATNPFLRAGETSVKEKMDQRAGAPLPSEAAVFAAIRAWKDTF
ncbi:hydroxyacylglutathione hydrolase [Pseudomonas japonica]|uniref:hydroxyacylglutathione hydrolase n=1 Tax=Pseudomonas japonica TaxID=256466 RepID=UPI0015E41848|nr:hydroxyacylglutathione hydrolase [Pseudomonas japonica]MBA1243657.1 hydroxyacylglutathione hydrolase [Pseudomonas japonica]